MPIRSSSPHAGKFSLKQIALYISMSIPREERYAQLSLERADINQKGFFSQKMLPKCRWKAKMLGPLLEVRVGSSWAQILSYSLGTSWVYSMCSGPAPPGWTTQSVAIPQSCPSLCPLFEVSMGSSGGPTPSSNPLELSETVPHVVDLPRQDGPPRVSPHLTLAPPPSDLPLSLGPSRPSSWLRKTPGEAGTWPCRVADRVVSPTPTGPEEIERPHLYPLKEEMGRW